jgi:hypothetical protein
MVGNRRQPLRQNICGSHRSAIRHGGLFIFLLRDYQDLFQPAQIGRRFHPNIKEELRSRRNLGNRAYGQAFGENLVATAGHHFLSRLNGLVGHYFFQDDFAERCSAQNPLQSRFLENCSYTAGLIIDQQYL